MKRILRRKMQKRIKTVFFEGHTKKAATGYGRFWKYKIFSGGSRTGERDKDHSGYRVSCFDGKRL